MRAIVASTLRQALEIGIQGKACVSAWHGYPHTVYVGFDEHILPAPQLGRQNPEPRHELQAEFARWSVEERSEVRGTSADPEEHADAALNLLVGCRVMEWEMEAITYALTIRFERELVFRIIPLADTAALGEHAWALRTPVGTYLEVCCGGELFCVDENEPAKREWRRLEPPIDGSLSPN